MGELPPDPLPVTIVGPDGKRSAMTLGLYAFLTQKGIIRGQLNDQRAAGLDEFQPSFDVSQVLSPIQRSNEGETVISGAAVLELTNTITAPTDRVVVVRALTWIVADEPPAILPDTVEVLFRGAVDAAIGVRPVLDASQPFPLNGAVIGSVSSPLTSEFNRLLPFAILSGGRVEFIQRLAVAGILSGELVFLQEEHLSPFRPAGL